MLAALQPILNFILTFSAKLGIVFMIICTIFVVISLIHGDIKISMVRDETDKEDKQLQKYTVDDDISRRILIHRYSQIKQKMEELLL